MDRSATRSSGLEEHAFNPPRAMPASVIPSIEAVRQGAAMQRRLDTGLVNYPASGRGCSYFPLPSLHTSSIRRAGVDVRLPEGAVGEWTTRRRDGTEVRSGPRSTPFLPTAGVVSRTNTACQSTAEGICGFSAAWGDTSTSTSAAAVSQRRYREGTVRGDRLLRLSSSSITSDLPVQESVASSVLPHRVPRGSSPFAATVAAGLATLDGDGGRNPPGGAEQAYVGGTRCVTRHFSSYAQGVVMQHSASGAPSSVLPSSTTQRQVTVAAPRRGFANPCRSASVVECRHEGRMEELASRAEKQTDCSGRNFSRSGSPLRRRSGRVGGSWADECLMESQRQRLNEFRPSFPRPATTGDAQYARRRALLQERRGGGSGTHAQGSRGGVSDMHAVESFTSDIHRSLTSGVIRSLFSAVAAPFSASFSTTWEEQERTIGSHSSILERLIESGMVLGGSGASIFFVATSSSGGSHAETPEEEVGRFMEAMGCLFHLDEHGEGDCPVLLVGGNSGLAEAEEVLEQWLADAGGPLVPPQQIEEARNVLGSLEQHTICWTFEERKPSKATESDPCSDEPSRVVVQNSRKSVNRMGTRCGRETELQSATQNGKECCICLSAFDAGDVLLTLRCLHIFHAACLNRWIKTSHSVKCPLCATAIAEQHTQSEAA